MAEQRSMAAKRRPKILCGWCRRVMQPTDDDYGDPDNGWYEHLCHKCVDEATAKAEAEANTNTAAQEEVVSALYDFAGELGLDVTDETVRERIRHALPLERIVTAYGFNIAEIQ